MNKTISLKKWYRYFLVIVLVNIICGNSKADGYWENIFVFKHKENIPTVGVLNNGQLNALSKLINGLIQKSNEKTSNCEYKKLEVQYMHNGSSMSIDIKIPIMHEGIYGPSHLIKNSKYLGNEKYLVNYKGYELEVGYLPEQKLGEGGELVQYFPADTLIRGVTNYSIKDYGILEKIFLNLEEQYNAMISNLGKKTEITSIQTGFIKIALMADPDDEKFIDKVKDDFAKSKINKKLLKKLEPIGDLIVATQNMLKERCEEISSYKNQGKPIEEIGNLFFKLNVDPEILITHQRPGYGKEYDPQKYKNWQDIHIYPQQEITDTIIYFTSKVSFDISEWETIPKTKLHLSRDYIDYAYMMQGWEWATWKYPTSSKSYYIRDISIVQELKEEVDVKQETSLYKREYFQYQSHPQYRFLKYNNYERNDNDLVINEYNDSYAYDNQGNLVRVLYFFNSDNPFIWERTQWDIEDKLWYKLLLSAYNSNQLNIQSYGDEINNLIKWYLNLPLTEEATERIRREVVDRMIYLDAYSGNEKYSNDPAYNWFAIMNEYLKNIKILTTERIDDVTFRTVYADTSGTPVFEEINRFFIEKPFELPWSSVKTIIYDKSEVLGNSEDYRDVYAKIVLPSGSKITLKNDYSIPEWPLDAFWEEGEDGYLILFTGEGTSYYSIKDDNLYEGRYHAGKCWNEEWVGGEEGSSEGGLEEVGYYPDPSKADKLISIKFYNTK